MNAVEKVDPPDSVWLRTANWVDAVSFEDRVYLPEPMFVGEMLSLVERLELAGQVVASATVARELLPVDRWQFDSGGQVPLVGTVEVVAPDSVTELIGQVTALWTEPVEVLVGVSVRSDEAESVPPVLRLL